MGEKIKAEINQNMNGETDEKKLERIRAAAVKRYLGDALFPNFKMPSDHVPIAAVIRYYPERKIRPPSAPLNIYGTEGMLDAFDKLTARPRGKTVYVRPAALGGKRRRR